MAVTGVDRLLGTYIAFLSAVLVWRGGLGSEEAWLLAAHALFALLLVLFARLRANERVGHWLHDLYPLMLLSAFYAEFGVLSAGVSPARIAANDAVVQGWEGALFGAQVSYTWIRAAPSVFWSTVLHAAYFSYYPILLLGPVAPMVMGRREAGRRVLLTTMVAFVACYVVFVLFPVAGPNYAFDHPTGPVREVWSARLVYRILESGSSIGTAFPSSHVAATLATVFGLWTAWRPLALLFALPAALLVVGTVYCQMHYGVDAAAGVLVAGAAAVTVRALARTPRG